MHPLFTMLQASEVITAIKQDNGKQKIFNLYFTNQTWLMCFLIFKWPFCYTIGLKLLVHDGS